MNRLRTIFPVFFLIRAATLSAQDSTNVLPVRSVPSTQGGYTTSVPAALPDAMVACPPAPGSYPLLLPVDMRCAEEFGNIAERQQMKDSTHLGEYAAKGWCLSSMGKWNDASAEFLRTLDTAPDDPSALRGLALSYAAQECLPEAIETFRSALRRDSANDPELMLNAGIACEHYARSLRQDSSASARILDTAIMLYHRAAEYMPRNGYLNYCLGRAHFLKGDYRQAQELFGAARTNCFEPVNNRIVRLADEILQMQISARYARDFRGYNPAKHYLLYISVAEQNMLLVRQGGVIENVFAISTGLNGSSYDARLGTRQTPKGVLRIGSKIGEGAAKGTVFKSKMRSRRVAPIYLFKDDVPPRPHDFVLTRVMELDGVEPGINKGRDRRGRSVDARSRCIYIHGTNNEARLGMPFSHGCIRMSSDDVVTLFNHIPVGTFVIIE